ncbi:MAG: hypothetical protein ACLR2E_16985 [Lachnospiraceae bacterium]
MELLLPAPKSVPSVKAAELLSGKITAVLKDLNFLDVKFAIDFQESAGTAKALIQSAF